jgi:hypothetical protein
MFNFKKIFNKDIVVDYGPCTFEKIEEDKTLIKFNSKIKKNYSFYENDLFDERGVLSNNSLLKNSFENEFEIYQWIKKDREFVYKDEVICIVRYLPYTNPHGYYRIAVLPSIKSPESGVLNISKQEDEGVSNESEICRIIHTEKPNDNYPINEEVFYYYFNKYEIPLNLRIQRELKGQFDQLVWHYEQDKIHLLDWLVEDKTYVNEGTVIAQVGAIYDEKTIYTFSLKAKVSGFVYRILPSFYSEPIYQDSLLCCFYKTYEDLHNSIYFNQPNLIHDVFTNNKIIKWDIIGGYVLPFGSSDSAYNIGALIINSINHDSHLMISLENYDSKDYIVFKYFINEYKLSPKDLVSFKYEDDLIDTFEIVESPVKISGSWNGFYETKVPITQNEIKNLCERNFLNWKIQFFNGSEFIIGVNYNERYNDELMQKIIKDFTKEYVELVKSEIAEHKPLIEKAENNFKPSIEACHVYLMHDTTNDYYKIGISIKPEYREKTLQSDKPTIELICSKEYPDRGIAKSIENALHINYKVKHIRGEWFELNSSDVENIIKTLK